jgi:glycosyltransferase involved in cell wall biosynthesis
MFSLIIPTHNRASILKRALSHLFQLEGIAECEVIVVDDGSTDRTADVLAHFLKQFPTLLRVFSVPNGGPGSARNHGIRAAKNERILFIDDDVFPCDGMLQSHWRLLNAGYTGSQGILLWHPDITMTPLIRYIDSRGMQFAFDRVADPNCLDFPYIYTANFAVQKEMLLRTGGFDESLFSRRHGFSAFEDTVVGYKLLQLGAKLVLNKSAIAHHLHDMETEDCLRREYKVGYTIGLLLQRYPAVADHLGLSRKNFLVRPQIRLLEWLNRRPVLEQIFGYPFAMRLRHREAVYRGLALFNQELARKRGAWAG